MSERAVRWVFVGAMLAMAAYGAARFELSTDVTNFMPEESREEFAVLASRLADSELTRTMILSVGAPDTDTAVRAAKALAERLEGHPEIAWLRRGLEPEPLADLYRLYFPRRHRFLSERPEQEIPELARGDALRARARAAREQLALPTGTLFERLVPEDPLGAFERVVRRLRAAPGGSLDVRDGQFVTRDGRFAVILLATRASAFDSTPQKRVLSDLATAFAEVDAEQGGALELETSGANRFAVAAEESMRGDVYRISAASFLGVAVVFLAFLRSLPLFWLAVLPALAGVLTGATVTQLLLGHLDGLTMAFGASLVGVVIDYSIHVIDYHMLYPRIPPRRIVRQLRGSLALGALTTIASFAGLCLTSFPGFREIGVFSMTGVATALLVTFLVLPGLLAGRHDAEPPRLSRRTAAALGRFVRGLSARPRVLVAVPVLCGLLMAAGLPRLRFVDDLSRLMAIDPELRAEEARVRERVARLDDSRVVVALGADDAEAVARNDAVAERLRAARARGEVAEFRSLHALLWSAELQDRNLAALAAIPDLAARAEAAFVAEGFRPGALAPFRDALAAEPLPPLGPDALRDSPLAPLLSSLLLDLGEPGVAAITYLRGVASREALDGALEGLPHVYVFDQRSFLNEIYREFRATTLRQLFVGCALVVVVIFARYRRLRPTLAAFLPNLLVAGVVLALFGLLGVETNLLHLMSLAMVMGMGVDYGIFLVDSARDPEHVDATMLSLLLSTLTTIFVFGTLALSEHTALRAMGATAGLGIALSFLLAPVTLLWFHPPAGEAPR